MRTKNSPRKGFDGEQFGPELTAEGLSRTDSGQAELRTQNQKKVWVWTFVIVGFVLASLAPTFYELSRMGDLKAERSFELVHNFPTDYNFYLSRIIQGLEGRLTVVEKYTSEPHAGSFLHEFYLLLGQVGRWVRVPEGRAGDVYHVARVVLGLALLALIAEYCQRSFNQMRSGETFFRDAQGALRSPHLLLRTRQASFYKLSLLLDSWRDGARKGAAPRVPTLLTSHFSLLAFLLAVTASSWPKLVAVVNNNVVPATVDNITSWRFGGYMSWWSVMDSLQRITFIPHLLAGQALMLFLIMALTELGVLKKEGNILFLGILAFLLGMIFPPGLVFVYAVMGVIVVIRVIWERRGIRGMVVPYGMVAALSAPSLVYLLLMATFYPWKRLAEFDILHPLPFEYLEYFQAVGPMLPLGLIGLLVAIKRKERAMLPSVAWVGAWLLLLVVFRFVPQQSPLRFSEMIPQVPAGVLTAYLFYYLVWRAEVGNELDAYRGSSFARSVKVQTSHSPSTLSAKAVTELEKTRRAAPLARLPARLSAWFRAPFRVVPRFSSIAWVLLYILITLGIGQMYSSYLWQRDFVDHKIRASLPLVPTGSYVMYPLKDFIRAIGFLYDYVPNNGIVLSETTAGNYIPVYSGKFVYVGHDNTVAAEVKKELVKQFFAGKMSHDVARQFLVDNRVAAVFFGPQEKEDGGIKDLAGVYSFLERVYSNTHVVVYQVK